MISIAECQAVAAQRLELAVLFAERKYALIASSKRWDNLATRLQSADSATLGLYRAVMEAADESVICYRGHVFSVVEAGNPPAWKWTFEIPGQREKAGYSSTQELALKAAVAVIDTEVETEQRVDAALNNLGINAVRELVDEMNAASVGKKQ